MSALAYQAASKAYASLDLETAIETASPYKLILMLYDGALAAIYRAKIKMSSGDVSGKGAEVSRAISIVDDGLRASLNLEVGGEIAANLHALYEYICYRLLQGNLKNDPTVLDEVMQLVSDLRGAWEKVGGNSSPEVSNLNSADQKASVKA